MTNDETVRGAAVIEADWKAAREAVFAAQEAAERLTVRGQKVSAQQAADFKALTAKRDALKAELAAARKAGV